MLTHTHAHTTTQNSLTITINKRMHLADRPSIVIATPSRALAHLRSEVSSGLSRDSLFCLSPEQARTDLEHPPPPSTLDPGLSDAISRPRPRSLARSPFLTRLWSLSFPSSLSFLPRSRSPSLLCSALLCVRILSLSFLRSRSPSPSPVARRPRSALHSVPPPLLPHAPHHRRSGPHPLLRPLVRGYTVDPLGRSWSWSWSRGRVAQGLSEVLDERDDDHAGGGVEGGGVEESGEFRARERVRRASEESDGASELMLDCSPSSSPHPTSPHLSSPHLTSRVP